MMMMVIMTKKAKKTTTRTMSITKMIMWSSREVKLSDFHFGGPS